MYIFSGCSMKQLSNGAILSSKCERKCESLWKQSQKYIKECSYEFVMKATPGKVDVGNSMALFFSLKKWEKCENLMWTKTKKWWRSAHMNSGWMLPWVKLIWAIQWNYFRVFGNERNVRTLCKQSHKLWMSAYELGMKVTLI